MWVANGADRTLASATGGGDDVDGRRSRRRVLAGADDRDGAQKPGTGSPAVPPARRRVHSGCLRRIHSVVVGKAGADAAPMAEIALFSGQGTASGQMAELRRVAVLVPVRHLLQRVSSWEEFHADMD